MLLVVSLPRLPRSWPIRLLTGWYWIYCISIVVAYRASLTAILANPAPRVTIDTLNELAHSPIGCGVWGEQNKNFFLTSSDETSQKIGEKIEIVNDAEKAVSLIRGIINNIELNNKTITFRSSVCPKVNLPILKMNIFYVKCVLHMIK